MLSTLLGSQNVEKILYFLLINEKCYGTQLHRFLATPLTPIQKGLERLEKAGVVKSTYEGKTRFYQFNPAYPLKEGLENLLRKAYDLLPLHEKKKYYAIEQTPKGRTVLSTKQSQDTLFACWNRLKNVKMLLIHAKLLTSSKRGKGDVKVVEENETSLCFHETGSWEEENMQFSNTLRWTLDVASGTIALEHLRFGVAKPVFLVHLKPKREGHLESIDSHLCGPHTYFGKVQITPHFLNLRWRIIGTNRNDRIECFYT